MPAPRIGGSSRYREPETEEGNGHWWSSIPTWGWYAIGAFVGILILLYLNSRGGVGIPGLQTPGSGAAGAAGAAGGTADTGTTGVTGGVTGGGTGGTGTPTGTPTGGGPGGGIITTPISSPTGTATDNGGGVPLVTGTPAPKLTTGGTPAGVPVYATPGVAAYQTGGAYGPGTSAFAMAHGPITGPTQIVFNPSPHATVLQRALPSGAPNPFYLGFNLPASNALPPYAAGPQSAGVTPNPTYGNPPPSQGATRSQSTASVSAPGAGAKRVQAASVQRRLDRLS
jgi:hypothetical protein